MGPDATTRANAERSQRSQLPWGHQLHVLQHNVLAVALSRYLFEFRVDSGISSTMVP